jgi:hypothetical protein
MCISTSLETRQKQWYIALLAWQLQRLNIVCFLDNPEQ